jgi:membrane-associated phospholipid phosphatase
MADDEVLNCLVAACSPQDMPANAFLVWAYISLSVRMLLIAAALYAALWQDLPTAIALGGSLLVAGFGYSLKALIGHERQFPDCGYGHAMPSMHALVAVYFATYYSLCFWRYSRWGWVQLVYRIVAVSGYAFLVCVSRVQLRAGDALEVAVGAILGSASALLILHVLMHALKTGLPGGMKED